MTKFVRIADGFVQEIIECEDINTMHHPDCGFRPVSAFANEPKLLDQYDVETNSFREFVPPPDPNSPYPAVVGQIPVTELGNNDGNNGSTGNQ